MSTASKYAHRRPVRGGAGKASTLKDDLRVAIRFFKMAHGINKAYLPLQAAAALAGAARAFPAVIFPKLIIDELTGAQRVPVFLLLCGGFLLLTVLIEQLGTFLNTRVAIANMAMTHAFEARLGERHVTMKFEALEDPDILDMKEKALVPIEQYNAIEFMMFSSLGLLRNGVMLLGLLGILFTLDWVLIAALCVLVAVKLFLYSRQQKIEADFQQELAVEERRWNYYRQLATDFSMGKDMRLYRLAPFLMNKIRAYHDEVVEMTGRIHRRYARLDVPSAVVSAVQTAAIYGSMVWKVLAASLSIGSFSMYVAAAAQFSAAMTDFFNSAVRVRTFCRYLADYMAYEALDLSQESGGDQPVPADKTIEFRHVWFRYPRSDDYVLRDVSIVIPAGEKLSVVGQNGAGKTTFIKLLCRLYEPDKGEILFGGRDIRTLSYDDYMKELAVVFQDYKLFAFTVRENIAADKEMPDDAIWQALREAGVAEEIAALPNGLLTPLYKAYDNRGVELSGGQSQKLAIARSVARRASVVVLDEPTAALDPYAEAEIYTRFHELVAANTAVYISHRLSSCRFCDRIAVFRNGAIVELGTHDELLAKGGHYAELFTAQAQYYQ